MLADLSFICHFQTAEAKGRDNAGILVSKYRFVCVQAYSDGWLDFPGPTWMTLVSFQT